MSIDKSWTRPTLNRNSPEFKLGLNDFYERCKAHINDRGLCCCPCRLCGNRDKLTPINIKHHIHNNGFSRGYPTWVHHGEPRIIPPSIVDDTNDMINVLNDVLRENNYIEPEPNTEHNTNTASTSNAPPQAAGPTKDDMEGLFEMANEELFQLGKDNKDEEICPTCKASRWKNKDTTRKKVPNKVLRYFPLIPRLKRMYGSLHTAKHMTWHATGKCTEDGKMGHPVDGKAWKEFDKNNPEFAKEHRNVRLGLAADGFNPFGNLSQSYSMWPVILTTYNTPPWICMKESSFMLTCLIPGPKSPGKDMDVYLQPLVKELKTLWKKPGTISDFPARSSLSGWSGQGYLACPTCNEETPSTRVNRKSAYVGHRRFLPTKHRWRNDKTFNGKSESRPKPKKLTSAEILKQLADVPSRIPGKHPSYGGVKRQRDPIVEKDVCRLWLSKKGNGKFIKPHAAYSFPPEKKQKFCEFIKGVKLSDGFGSNFKPKVTDNDNNIIGMKSHDCHLMMQQLLPAGAQAYLDSSIATPIIELCSFFKQICARSIKESDMLIAKDQLNVPTRFNRPDRNDDGPPLTSELEVFRLACTPKSAGVGKKLDHEVKKKLVCECRLAMPENDLPTKFSPWFRDKVNSMYM
ncbi:hypothetical protein Tco_0304426 [Tanacetum coccineum]